MNLKYLSFIFTSTFLLFSPALLTGQEDAKEKAENKPLKAKLVSISANTGLAEEDKNLQRLFNNSSNPGIRLTFLLKAKNIVQVLEKTVTITTKDTKGWKCGSFPRISEEGDAASFVIENKGDFIGKADKTNLEGTIDVQTGTKLIPKSFSLLSFDEPLRMDDFIFTLLEDKLKIEGNHKLIKEISVEYNDKMLRTYGSSWSDDTRTYNYKGIGKGAKITFSYWDGLVTKKVHFSKK